MGVAKGKWENQMIDQVIYSPKSRKMRESNERSRDLWKILEKEFKIYKYAQSEHEAGIHHETSKKRHSAPQKK